MTSRPPSIQTIEPPKKLHDEKRSLARYGYRGGRLL